MTRLTSWALAVLAAVAFVGMPTVATAWRCNDGRDNDGDGVADYPDDPGCHGWGDWTETSADLPCDDGVDNEPTPDGLKDWPDDPGCESLIDEDEITPTLVCDDGIDNDGDGLEDLADPGCEYDSIWTLSELGDCIDGLDNDGDGLIDFGPMDGTLDPGEDPGCCGQREACQEEPECDDGIDNDGDGDVDEADHECQCSNAGGSSWWPCRSHASESINVKLNGGSALSCGLGWELAILGPILWAARRFRRRRLAVAVLGAMLVGSMGCALSSPGVLWAHQVNDTITAPAVFVDQLRDNEPLITTPWFRFIPSRWVRWPTYPLVAPLHFTWSFGSGLAYGFYAVPAEILSYRAADRVGSVSPLHPNPRHVWVARTSVLPGCDWPWAKRASGCLDR